MGSLSTFALVALISSEPTIQDYKLQVQVAWFWLVTAKLGHADTYLS